MSFIEIIGAVLSLDLVFLVDIIMNNLFWIFGFFCAGHIFSGGKDSIITGLFFAVLVLVSGDLFSLINFSIYTAYGLMVLYLIRVAALLFLENTKGGSKHIPVVWVLTFFITIALMAYGVF